MEGNKLDFIKSEENTNEPEVLLTIGGKVDKASVSLRFFGDELEPDEITEKLKCSPTNAFRKGDIVPNKFKPRVCKTGSWHLHTEKNSEQNLEEQILELFGRLTEDLEIWQSLTKQFEADVYCGAWLNAWNRDIWLTPNLLKQISDRGLHLGIAIYCDSDDEDEE